MENITELDPLKLDLTDDQIVEVVDSRKQDFKTWASEIKLKDRQDKNFRYMLGDQLSDKKIPKYSLPYMENVIHESITRIKPIALSRLPDMTVEPGQDTPESKQNADKLTQIVNSDIKKRKNRQVLGLAHKQEPIYFYSVIKARWNRQKEEYEFININPQKVFFDRNCTTNDVDDMTFFGEERSISVKTLIMMFPNKKDDLLDYLGWKEEDRKSEKRLASEIECEEVWFHWFKNHTDELSGEEKWERIDGTVWKYKTLVLGKMKNPYFDYEGEPKYFVMEEGKKREVNEEDVRQLLFGGQEVQEQTVFNNYFQNARKPYFLMVYENWGNSPIGVTSRVEQIINFQDNINDQGRQIGDMNRRSVGKDIYSTEGIDKKDVEKIDPANPRQAIAVKGKINEVYAHVGPNPAPAQLYNAIQSDRSKAFEMMGVNATTRGVRETGDDTLGGMQMMREADYGLIDDLVEDTINAAAEWMSQWAMQFIKLFYTKPKMIRSLGRSGETVFNSLSQDLVEDGMEVVVSASGVDKLQRKRLAVENAKLGMSDPLTFFEDTDQTRPRERAMRSMMFKMSPQMYMTTYLMEQNQGTQQAQNTAAMLQPESAAPATPTTPPPPPQPIPQQQ